jgi:hypothetical protein
MLMLVKVCLTTYYDYDHVYAFPMCAHEVKVLVYFESFCGLSTRKRKIFYMSLDHLDNANKMFRCLLNYSC